MIQRLFIKISLLVSTMIVAGLCGAGEFIKPGEERLYFKAGVFLQNLDTTVEVKGGGSGEKVSLEDDLGYDDDDHTYMVGGYWRFASRHRIAIGYFESDRDAKGVANTDIDIGEGETLPVGAGFDSKFNIKVLPVQYAYSFIKNDKFELAGTAGFHWYSIDYKIAGAAGIGNIDVNARVSVDADAPMPLIGLGLDYYLTERWNFSLLGEAFWMNIDSGENLSFKGTIYNLQASTEYWIWNHLGVGAGLNYFALDVDVDDSSWNGKLEYDYWGPQIYLTSRF